MNCLVLSRDPKDLIERKEAFYYDFDKNENFDNILKRVYTHANKKAKKIAGHHHLAKEDHPYYEMSMRVSWTYLNSSNNENGIDDIILQHHYKNSTSFIFHAYMDDTTRKGLTRNYMNVRLFLASSQHIRGYGHLEDLVDYMIEYKHSYEDLVNHWNEYMNFMNL